VEPVGGSPRSAKSARSILAAAAVVHIILFAFDARGTFADFFRPRRAPLAEMGGLIVRGADNIGYYAWLRSPLIDGDFDFGNDYAPLFAHYPATKGAIPVTATGRRENH